MGNKLWITLLFGWWLLVGWPLPVQAADPMTDQIVGFSAGGQTAFVVVGTAHVIGPQGIVALLWEKGYQVD